MRDYKIHGLFPVPVYITDIGREFTKKELQFIKDQKNYCQNNLGNIHTKDNYILNRPELKYIKNFIEEVCQSYLDNIICPKGDVKIYVTQSWLNYTEENQYHHKHEHPNSFASGVFYIDSDKETDSIKFFNPMSYKQISPEINENKYNPYNSGSWFFPVETGKIIMFPSSTTHQVDNKKGSNTRISLAFNTFLKGKIGPNNDLAELIL
tara:strand:+ start:1209 stop:1832 length:624 start_codon:yes stop_codon:yes gene_type:complete